MTNTIVKRECMFCDNPKCTNHILVSYHIFFDERCMELIDSFGRKHIFTRQDVYRRGKRLSLCNVCIKAIEMGRK